jgi:hypothetical protein
VHRDTVKSNTTLRASPLGDRMVIFHSSYIDAAELHRNDAHLEVISTSPILAGMMFNQNSLALPAYCQVEWLAPAP